MLGSIAGTSCITLGRTNRSEPRSPYQVKVILRDPHSMSNVMNVNWISLVVVVVL